MNQLFKLEEFYKSLKDISVINSDLDNKRDELKKEVYVFNKSIQERKIDKNISKQNEDMAKLLEGTIELIRESSNSWVANFQEMLEKEKFRSDLANYFIIIIFGKVKAGKSSLGNFVANHKLNEQTVEFFKYDEAGKKQDIKKLEELDEDKFDTNNLECTVEIQGFKLDGMAWIDTPGLGSMVKENGDLAKEYMQSADYIIYPLSSDAPEQIDDLKVISKLAQENKKITICITKSDEYEEDECECGSEEGCYKCNEGITSILKNKSIENRQAQELGIKNQIKDLLKNHKKSILGDIFSISTHTATKGLAENNEELFKNSNMPKFYELITKVVQEKATKLKEETPYDGLKSFIDNNILGNNDNTQKNSIANIKQALENLDEKIDESLERFHILQSNANSDLESEVESVVSEYYSKIDKSNSKEIFVTIDEKLNIKISTIIQNNIYEIFADFDTTLKSLSSSFGTSDFEIHDTYQTIEYTTETRNKTIGSGLLGTGAAIGAGFFLASNPVGWIVAGTMAVSIAGGYIGGEIGKATGSTQTEQIKVGDNKEEIIQKFKSIRLEHYELFAKSIYQQMQDTFFTPLQNTSQDISSSLNRFEIRIIEIL